MRRVTLAARVTCICSLVALSSISSAGVFVLGTVEEAPNLATHWLITLTAYSDDPAESIVRFDFGHRAGQTPETDFGIFGRLNQVNPGGVPTVFQDANPAFPLIGAFPDQDSQFLFTTTSINPLLVYDPGRSNEGPLALQADFAFSEGLGTSVPFAQILSISDISYRGEITVLRQGIPMEIPIEGGIFHLAPRVPEPTTALLATCAILVGTAAMQARRA